MSVQLTLNRAYLATLDARPLHAGDTYPIACTATEAGTPIPLSKVWVTIKRQSADPDSEALLQLISTNTDQLEITDSGAGEFTIKFNPDETAGIAGTWPFDIQIMDTSGNIVTLAYGTIEFLPNITRGVS